MIRLENVSKEYNGVNIIKNISINFRKNGLVCILGPSGSGKSTLLNLIGGNTTGTGNIYLGQTNINELNLEYYHNHYISYIYQNYNLINNLDVHDNITLGLKLRNQKIKKDYVLKVLKDL